MIELYHFGFSPCSQKIHLVLVETGLAFESHEVDLMAGGRHDAEYVKLNPNHVVPPLVHDGQVLIESSLIIKYLDDAFPEPPLRPHDAGQWGLRTEAPWQDVPHRHPHRRPVIAGSSSKIEPECARRSRTHSRRACATGANST